MMLKVPKGATKRRRIVGRGSSSGCGKTCGRGHNGQNSRSGGGVRLGFEGGQMPLYRRIARRGFSNHPFRKEWIELNLEKIEANFNNGEIVSPHSLQSRGLVSEKIHDIKVLANGELKTNVVLQGVRVSAGAMEKIIAAGGRVEMKTVSMQQKKSSNNVKVNVNPTHQLNEHEKE